MTLLEEFRRSKPKERVHNAVEVDLAARFMVPTGAEHSCRVIEMSTGEMRFASTVCPAVGECVIVYLADLGRFEGDVDRHEDVGFAIGLKLTEMKHRKLAGQLVWFANREAFDLPESRRHRRFVPIMQWTILRLATGKENMAKIVDLSSSGVNIEANARVMVGSAIAIGSRAAKVSRVYDGGFVAEFVEPFADGELDETSRL